MQRLEGRDEDCHNGDDVALQNGTDEGALISHTGNL